MSSQTEKASMPLAGEMTQQPPERPEPLCQESVSPTAQ